MNSSVRLFIKPDLALNNVGATYLFFYSLFLLSFSLTIWYVLYRLPYTYGLISVRNNKETIKLDPRGSYIDTQGSVSGKQNDLLVQDLLQLQKEED